MSIPAGSRRSFLIGLSSAFAAMPAAIAAAAPLHPADRAFITWFGAITTYNRQNNGLDFETDPVWQAVERAEKAFYALPPSPMALGALALMQISYETPHNIPIVDPRAAVDLYDSDRERWRVLECVRPLLSGLVGDVVADLLDNPERPFGKSILWQLKSGEVR